MNSYNSAMSRYKMKTKGREYWRWRSLIEYCGELFIDIFMKFETESEIGRAHV